MNFKTTADIKVSDKIINQVIGQDRAVDIMKKAAQQRRHVLLIGEPGTGKCVGKDTPIITEFGPVKASVLYSLLKKKGIELKREDENYVISNKDIFAYSIDKRGKIIRKRVTKAYKGKRKKGIRIVTASGADFVVSGEHPILTIKNNKLVFLPAEEVSESNFIALARQIPFPELKFNFENIKTRNTKIDNDEIQFIGDNNVESLRLKIPTQINQDIAYFLGLCIAEARWQGNFVIWNSNSVIQDYIVSVLVKEFNYPKENIIKSKNSLFLRKSRTLAHILEKSFDFPLNPKKQSYHKKIPRILFNLDNKIVSAFISGLIDGDGYIGKRGFEISSSSKELIYDLRILLLKLGILSRITSSLKCASNAKNKTKNIYFRLSIFDSKNLRKLAAFVDLKINSKKEGLKRFEYKKSTTNVDIIPKVGESLYDLKNSLGITYTELGQYPATFHKFVSGKRNISRDLASNIFKKFSQIYQHSLQGQGQQLVYDVFFEEKINELNVIINSDIFWDRIKSMELIEDDMYDFEVEDTHNMLVSCGVIVHNSMLGLALAELLPSEQLVDILSLPNLNDENQPLIKTVQAGHGREEVAKSRALNSNFMKGQSFWIFILAIAAMIAPWFVRNYYKSDIMFGAFFIGGMMFVMAAVLFFSLSKRMPNKNLGPKIIVDNFKKLEVPFLDATGAHAGALLGDVLHDPFQSGGLGTPSNERVVAGMIHKANMGVLFIDEMATLQPATQQELLTALQEGKYSITGQSERSAGAMVRTEPVPCNFILVAAGNTETVKRMHPALRSRIRGYGYEVYMNETMKDIQENRDKIAKFVAQEVVKDEKIPHFSRQAVNVIIEEARKKANRKGHLTLRLRDLGGLIRAAGDLAKEQKAKIVEPKHIEQAKLIAKTLEQQIADKYIERKKEYDVIVTNGCLVGRVNGLAVIGGADTYSGIVLPIESQVTPGGKEKEIVATGNLGKIAKEAVKNVSAIIKKYFGADIKKYDLYVQFLQTYEGVEGDSASIAVATSIISALEKVPIRQDTALTGSLSVRGDVLPVGGVSAKVESAIEAGIKRVIVPKSNIKDIVVKPEQLKKVKIIPVTTISEVLKEAMDWNRHKKVATRLFKK